MARKWMDLLNLKAAAWYTGWARAERLKNPGSHEPEWTVVIRIPFGDEDMCKKLVKQLAEGE